MKRSPRQIRLVTVAACASALIATVGNAPLWRTLYQFGLLQARDGWLLALTLAGMLAAALFALVSLLSWKPVLKPALILLLLASAIGAHFMWSYRIVIDGAMATNTLQTDWREARALLTWRLAFVVLFGAVLPACLLWRLQLRHRPWKEQAWRNAAGVAIGLAAVAGFILLSFQPLASSMRNHKELRYLMNPLNTLWALGQVAFASQRVQHKLAPVGLDARLLPRSGKPRLLVLVLGETARSDRFGINGYPRDTTPELAQAQVASFRDAWACGTDTAASVPCMFSPLGREGFQVRTQDSENLMDVLQHAGLAVLWLDNQPGGCKGVCDRVPTVNTSGLQDPKLCPEGECRDEILLAGLDQRLAALPVERRNKGVVLVMHQMGSHGPAYAQRAPPHYKLFRPECTSAHLPDCAPAELRNAYDNTIAYTDHVLGQTIRWLQNHREYDTGMVYVADHGESLGENNLYLHGLPYALAPDVQKRIPWITWLSPAFERSRGISLACLRGRGQERITHDHLFHSVLGLMQVATAAYQRPLDAYAACLSS